MGNLKGNTGQRHFKKVLSKTHRLKVVYSNSVADVTEKKATGAKGKKSTTGKK